jgi:hypothetical protein
MIPLVTFASLLLSANIAFAQEDQTATVLPVANSPSGPPGDSSAMIVIASPTKEEALAALDLANEINELSPAERLSLREKFVAHVDKHYNLYLTVIMASTTGYVAYELENAAIIAQGRTGEIVSPLAMGAAIAAFEGGIQWYVNPYVRWLTDRSFFIPSDEKGAPWVIYTKRLMVCMVFAGIVTSLGTVAGTDTSLDLNSVSGAVSSFFGGNLAKSVIYVGSTHYFFEFLAQQRNFASERVQRYTEAVVNVLLTQIANTALFFSRENQESGIWSSIVPQWLRETFGVDMNAVSAAVSASLFTTGVSLWTWSLPEDHGFRRFLKRRYEGCREFFGLKPLKD